MHLITRPAEIVERVRRKAWITFLIAVVIDDHLAIGFPLALLDDCCLAVAGLVLLDYGCSFAISIPVAVIWAYRHPGSNWTNSDTYADILRACGHCGANAFANTYFMNAP
jgi:hypothetical protein